MAIKTHYVRRDLSPCHPGTETTAGWSRMIALTGKDETMLMGTGPIPAAHCVRLNDLVHEAYRKSDYELVARINARFNEIGMQTFYDKAKDDVYLVVTPADVIPPDAG